MLAKQAIIPSGAMVLDNQVGTAAPGFYLQQGKAHVFVLPGVPREARDMMELQVEPILKKKLKATAILWSHAFNTVGLPETDIQRLVSPLFPLSSTVCLSLLASTNGVKVTLSCWYPKSQESISKRSKDFAKRDFLIQQVRKTLGPWLFSEGEQTMEEVVGQLLSSQNWSLAVAESCTGGLIAHRLTNVPGSSTYLDHGIVTYSNKAKQQLLGSFSLRLLRKYGAVSAQVAEAMARGIRAKSGCRSWVSVTGIAGPGGGSAKKPVGLVYMAIDGPRGSQSHRYQFWGNRTEIKIRSSQAALNMIRQYLLQAKV